MRKFYFTLLLIFGFVLLALFQNIGRLYKSGEQPRHLLFPKYFESIYKDRQNPQALKTQDDYESYLYKSPLYKQLLDDDTYRQACDSNDPHVFCPKGLKEADDKKKPVSFAFDPLRTMAQVRTASGLTGRVSYSKGANMELRAKVNELQELKLEYFEKSATGRVSYDIKW